MTRALLLAAALAAAAPAAAQVMLAQGPSGRWGSVDVGMQTYTPDIDAEFKARGDPSRPYAGSFTNSRGYMFQLGVWKSLYTGFGALEVGFRTGYWRKSGHGYVEEPIGSGNWVPSTAVTRLQIIPTSVALGYRFDWPVERYRIPLAPYARATLERYNWWITNSAGSMSEKGATNGWSATAGLAFLLDILDPTLAREFDRDSGVNHTYLFFEITKAVIDDFGSSKSWDMSPKYVALAGGLTFVF